MLAPAQLLRAVFALSTFACAIVLVLFVRGRAAWTTAFWVQLLATALLVSALVCALAFRRGRMRLAGVPAGRLARVFVVELGRLYVASAVAVTAIALAVVYAITRSGAESLALAVLAGLWLSLGLAPALAAVTSWRRLRAGRADDPSARHLTP